MTLSIFSPSISLRRVSVNCSESLRWLNCSSSVAFKNGIRMVAPNNSGKSRVFTVGSQSAVTDDLFVDYKPSCAFLFPGQGAQAVGMGAGAKNVPAAAALFQKANDILGCVQQWAKGKA